MRLAQFRRDACTSRKKKCCSGIFRRALKESVLQACVLSLTLFILHINDLLKIGDLRCYADDSFVDPLCLGHSHFSRNHANRIQRRTFRIVSDLVVSVQFDLLALLKDVASLCIMELLHYRGIFAPVQGKNSKSGSKRSLSASSSPLPVQIKRHKPSVPRELRLESNKNVFKYQFCAPLRKVDSSRALSERNVSAVVSTGQKTRLKSSALFSAIDPSVTAEFQALSRKDYRKVDYL
ncbi:hypothetical protein EVAR_79093_1 [Eumeta japonica]|uniref:Uncharacterized protein n=1 Tax=Eumeta variegata TaxID=151549 RepID=A0A4C1X3T2_EUMVA|nr:hypothetical protein EVAR_79093_1 [Eumeta japonica]